MEKTSGRSLVLPFLFASVVALFYILFGSPKLSQNKVSKKIKPLSISRSEITKAMPVLPHKYNLYSFQGRSPAAGTHVMSNKTMIDVGFFEGSRRAWNYHPLFQPPPSPRICECYSGKALKFYANVTLENDPFQTGMYDVLFFPQDVSVLPLTLDMMNTILTVAPKRQRRIYATFECSGKLKFLALEPPFNRKMFHWSLTYHSRSDFPSPYGYYRLFPKQSPSSELPINWAKNKSGLVAWMSTWTSKYWKRSAFVEKLKDHVPVQMFGEDKGKAQCPRARTECKQKMQQFKFYLALESACCSEYISEKFWRTLSWDIVVGASRESYEKLAPPHSFIFADDFETLQDLAQYILMLDRNDDLYNQYYRWKKEGEVIVNYPDLKGTRVTTKIPPEGFFYSCNAVCRTSGKYLDDKQGHEFNFVENPNNSTATDWFDPEVSWWWNSCAKCGKHGWMREFN